MRLRIAFSTLQNGGRLLVIKMRHLYFHNLICEKYIFPILSMFLKVKHLYKESKGWKRKEKCLNQRDSESGGKKLRTLLFLFTSDRNKIIKMREKTQSLNIIIYYFNKYLNINNKI